MIGQCASHTMHRFCRSLKLVVKFLNPEHKMFAICCFALLLNCSDLGALDFVLEHMFMVFLSPTTNERVRDSINVLKEVNYPNVLNPLNIFFFVSIKTYLIFSFFYQYKLILIRPHLDKSTEARIRATVNLQTGTVSAYASDGSGTRDDSGNVDEDETEAEDQFFHDKFTEFDNGCKKKPIKDNPFTHHFKALENKIRQIIHELGNNGAPNIFFNEPFFAYLDSGYLPYVWLFTGITLQVIEVVGEKLTMLTSGGLEVWWRNRRLQTYRRAHTVLAYLIMVAKIDKGKAMLALERLRSTLEREKGVNEEADWSNSSDSSEFTESLPSDGSDSHSNGDDDSVQAQEIEGIVLFFKTEFQMLVLRYILIDFLLFSDFAARNQDAWSQHKPPVPDNVKRQQKAQKLKKLRETADKLKVQKKAEKNKKSNPGIYQDKHLLVLHGAQEAPRKKRKAKEQPAKPAKPPKPPKEKAAKLTKASKKSKASAQLKPVRSFVQFKVRGYDLQNDDIHELQQPAGWVAGDVIDAYLLEKVIYPIAENEKMHPQDRYLFTNEYGRAYFVKGEIEYSEAVNDDRFIYFFGVLHVDNNHWCCFFANKLSQEFYFIDPLASEDDLVGHRVFENWTEFARINRVLCNTNWKIMPIKHSKQVDGYSCGIFVIEFLEKLIKLDLNLEIGLDAVTLNKKRAEIYERLYYSSEHQSTYCCKCGVQVHDYEAHWKCHSHCRRAAHYDCLQLPVCPVCPRD
jgi:hypothetical protein